jgi:hypothetical protein
MPATIVLSAIYGSTFMAAASLGAFGYAAATFGIRLVASYLISKLFAPDQPNFQSDGSRVQLPPATNNKVPVLYGSGWLRPIITDAKISTDQTQMWYVCTLCEKCDNGTMSIGNIYWGDKLLNFDAVDQTKVVSWTDIDGSVDTRLDGKINVYKYIDGSNTPQNTASSAITVLQNAAIDPSNHWTSTDRMDKTVFIVVRVSYNSDIGLTGLDNLNVNITNTVNKPGDVLYDYFTSERYGCGLNPSFVNTTSLNDINTYSDVLISYIDNNGNPQTQPRYRINGPIDTGNDTFKNLTMISEACDSWIQWNESIAKWGVIINKAYDQVPNSLLLSNLFNVTDTNIIGGIDLNPFDLNNTYVRVEAEYPDNIVKDNSGFAYVDLDVNFVNPNEPDNKLSLQLPLTNNNVGAQYIATRRLLQSREDLIITFNMDYTGMQIDAGDVIRLNNTKYGWVDKLFRVTQVVEGKDSDNITIIQITASEYNNDVYGDFAITEFVPSTNTGITNPNNSVAPIAPVIAVDDTPDSIQLEIVIPATGIYNTVEIVAEQSGVGPPPPNGWPERTVQILTATGNYINGQILDVVVSNPNIGPILYLERYRVRVRTSTGIWSPYSPYSAYVDWS